MIKIRRGLDLPIEGRPEQSIEAAASVHHVALVGDDHVGMKPTMEVTEGDWVKLGQVLFTDKKNPGVRYTSPGCGKVVSIHRGAKRKFESVVIRLEGSDEETFASQAAGDFRTLSRETVRDNLLASGLWTAIRARPFSKAPPIDSSPHSIFVQALDTQPLAADPTRVIADRERDFERGLEALAQLTDGKVWLCQRPGGGLPAPAGITVEEFVGPHPAGLPGTHIHKLDPVKDGKSVWYVNYQDVLAMGHLFLTGRLSVERVVSLAGPAVRRPRLVRTRLGASIEELVASEIEGNTVRCISGSVLTGRTAQGPYAFLGRFHLQVSCIEVAERRPFLGWLGPGFDRFSVLPAFASALIPGRRFAMNTLSGGDPRAIVPVGAYERVLPLDLLPAPLLKSLMVGDTERAQELGCLELDEEDLALCSFVCPGKSDFGSHLRQVLTTIEKEG